MLQVRFVNYAIVCSPLQVMVGDLPADFLRVSNSTEQRQIAADRQQAAMLQASGVSVFTPTASRLSITVVQLTFIFWK